MPKRVDPQWGRLGMVLPKEAQIFSLSDAEFYELIKATPLAALAGRESECRAWLNAIGEAVRRDHLQQKERPRWAEVHKALAEVRCRARVFAGCAANLVPLPDWAAEQSSLAPEGPLNAFCALPETLYAFAERARYEAEANGAPTAQLVAFAEATDRLAPALKWLNFVSQHLLSNALQQTNDYAVRNLADAVRIVQRLDDAASSALESRNKRGGPPPKPMMIQAVLWLAELWEYFGGKFTHNPRQKTEYQGSPQSPAGQFVTKFLKLCVPAPTLTAPSQFMAAAVAFRNRRRGQASEVPPRCAEATLPAMADVQTNRLRRTPQMPPAPAAVAPHTLGWAPDIEAAPSKDEPPP